MNYITIIPLFLETVCLEVSGDDLESFDPSNPDPLYVPVH